MEFKKFEKILQKTIKEFKEIKKIGFIGIMGSANMKNDLDVVISPEKNTKKGEFLKILCNFFEALDKNLKKQDSKLIVFYYSPLQYEVEYLSKRNKDKDVLLHLCSIIDITPPHPKTFKTMLDIKRIYLGKPEKIKEVKETNMDFWYNGLLILNCLYSKYPKKLEKEKMLHNLSYIFKHNNKKVNFQNKSIKQIYFECCDFLDSIAKEIN